MKSRYAKTSLLIFIGLFTISCALFATADDSPNIFMDSDQDRLTDEEEKNSCTDPNNPDTDGDGYSDGVEVEGGYDPCKHADAGDKIEVIKNGENAAAELSTTASQDASATENSALNKEDIAALANSITTDPNINQTDDLSNKLAAAVSSADGETGIDMATINEIVNSTMTTSISFEELPEIEQDSIKIKEQDYADLPEEERKEKEKQDSIDYLVSVAYLAAANAPSEISKPSDLTKLSQEIISQANISATTMSDFGYFDGIIEKGAVFLEQIKEVEVPENMLDKHIKGLQLASYSVTLKDDAKPDLTDPIASIQNLSKVQGVISLAMEFGAEISTELMMLGITEIPLGL